MSIALSSQQTHRLTQAITSLGAPEFCHDLLAFLRDVVPFDSAVIMGYPDHAKLLILHDELSARDRALFEGPYRNGLYLLSPLYTQADAGSRGCFHISDLAPRGFTESEFYQLYYSNNGAIDQVAYLCQSAAGTPIVISIERTERMPPFTDPEKVRLVELNGLVQALLDQHIWADGAVNRSTMPRDMNAHLQRVLDLFGSSVLTPREREVVRLILKGYPSKSVARELSISTQTEQVHRKNIYQKLGISSHSELFTLFFHAIAQPAVDTDPLLTLRLESRAP